MPKPKNWSDFHRAALEAGMDDASACYAADRAMERAQEDRDDVWRETMNREPNTNEI